MKLNTKLLETQEKNILFLESLQSTDNINHFYPAIEGITEVGSNLSLGFSCYALKTYYILGYWEALSQKRKEGWIDFIKGFQIKGDNDYLNYFEDPVYVSHYKKEFNNISPKENIKKIINFTGLRHYQTYNEKFKNSIRAETKQAISTLYEVGAKPNYPYNEFEDSDSSLLYFLNSLDWANPWSAGGQFSAICVFSKVNNLKNNINTLEKFSEKLLNTENGGYYFGKRPNNSLLINGAMKVLTGLDWIGTPIHKPKKLIDLCLTITPNSEGCDIVDIVYVLYKCTKITEYRKSDIHRYLQNMAEEIYKHYYSEYSGFSYFINKSQHEYYGVETTNGLKVPDLHGNLLLVWALSMISSSLDIKSSSWKILKP